MFLSRLGKAQSTRVFFFLLCDSDRLLNFLLWSVWNIYMWFYAEEIIFVLYIRRLVPPNPLYCSDNTRPYGAVLHGSARKPSIKVWHWLKYKPSRLEDQTTIVRPSLSKRAWRVSADMTGPKQKVCWSLGGEVCSWSIPWKSFYWLCSDDSLLTAFEIGWINEHWPWQYEACMGYPYPVHLLSTLRIHIDVLEDT